MPDETNRALLDEERRMSSRQEVKASIDDDVNARIRRESARVEPKESAELAGVAHELKQKSVREAAETERELGRGRTAARVSQIVDYLFYIIYGLIGLQFVLRLMGPGPAMTSFSSWPEFRGRCWRPSNALWELRRWERFKSSYPTCLRSLFISCFTLPSMGCSA